MLDEDVYFRRKYHADCLRFVGQVGDFRAEIELSSIASKFGIGEGRIIKLLLIPKYSENLESLIIFDYGWKNGTPHNPYVQKALDKIIYYFDKKKVEWIDMENINKKVITFSR